uniref:carbamoyl phosphate synthase preATP-grasp domain-containing protein n=1 Tax=Prevotella sp. TaxID=59823 RepID=UPI004027AB9B
MLGSGANRISSFVEFDWCGVQVLNTIRKEGWRSVMINYTPETVSTGGQIPSNLVMHLDAQNVPILGTAAKNIDNEEGRDKFFQMCKAEGRFARCSPHAHRPRL